MPYKKTIIINCFRKTRIGLILGLFSFSSYAASTLEEVVVTARKRSENVQSTPISISAFSADRLEAQGITRVNKLQDITPNLVFQNTPSNSGVGSNASIFIRGIGQKDFAPTTEPGVGLYVDGVYLSRTVGSVFDMIDIEQVEILRGPQGTLFGRNTIGGAINITTQKPSEKFAGKADIKLGSDGRIAIRGAVNIPLADTLFMRASAGSFQQDGYVHRPFDNKDLGDQDNKTFRAAFRWLASDNLEFNLVGEFSSDKSNGPPIVITHVDTPKDTPGSFATLHNAFAQFGPMGPGNPFACFSPEQANNSACYNQRIVAGKNTNLGTGPNFSDIDTSALTLTADWELGVVTIKSITAWREIDGGFAQDRDGGPQTDNAPLFNPLNHVADTFEQSQFSQELQVQGSAMGDRLKWLVGLYYFEEDGENLNNVDFRPVSIQSGGFFDYNSKAIFAQTTYHVSDPLSVTFGLRYTEEERNYLPDQFFEELPLGSLGFPCFVPSFQSSCGIGDRVVPYQTVTNNIEETTPYLNVAYQFNDNLMAYASYSEGFKSDGFTQRVFPPEPSLPRFEPEFVESYEVGFKSSLFGDTMRLNAAFFKTDYSELQLLVADASRIGPFTTNAGTATIQGFELELSWLPTDNWRINGGAGYTDAKYDSLNSGAIAAGLTLDSPFTMVSEWNINLAVEYTFSLASGASILPRIDWNWRSDFYTNANGIPFLRQQSGSTPLYQPSYSVVNANVKWLSADETYSVTIGVDNLNDEEYRIFGDYQPSFGFDMEAFDRGRQWYVQAGIKF